MAGVGNNRAMASMMTSGGTGSNFGGNIPQISTLPPGAKP